MLKSIKTEVEAIEQLYKHQVAMFNASNVTGLLTDLTEDAVFLPPNEPLVSGKEAIGSWLTKSFSDCCDLESAIVVVGSL